MIAKHIKTGSLGEDIACRFLQRKNFRIIERNYRKNYGEIDIIAEDKGKVNFIEVKTISAQLDNSGEVISENQRPEEKVDRGKIKKLGRAIRTYLEEKSIESEWEFKVVAVFLDSKKGMAKVRITEDVILE